MKLSERNGLLRTGLVVVIALMVSLCANLAYAENEGLDSLDKATDARRAVKTLSDLGEVITLCEKALDEGLDEGNTEFANNLLAASLIQRGQALSKAVFSPSGTPSIWVQLRTMSLKDLEKAVKLRGDQPEPYYEIARLNLLPGGSEKRAEEAVVEGLKYADEEPTLKAKLLVLRAKWVEDKEERDDLFRQATELDPDNADLIAVRAGALLDAQKYDEAIELCDQLEKVQADHPAIGRIKGTALMQLNKPEEALKEINKAMILQPRSPSLLILKANLLKETGHLSDAIDQLDMASMIAPDNLSIVLLRATYFMDLGQPEKALVDLDRIIKSRTDAGVSVPELLRMKGLLLQEMGRSKEARTMIEEYLTDQPEDWDMALLLAALYNDAKLPEKALEIYTSLLDNEDADRADIFRGRADAYLHLGKHAEAVADYERAIKESKDDSGSLNNLAWVLSTSPDDKVRNGKRAIELATEACELTDFQAAHILSTLAAAYAETGDFESALNWIKKAQAISESEEEQKALADERASYEAGKPTRELVNDKADPEEESEDTLQEPEPEPVAPTE